MSNLDRSNVHILVVEDDDDYLGELMEWMDIFGYQHVETASNTIEAKAKLEQKPFDVIIADMRLERDFSGGFAVLSEVTKRNITSVVIILTANDTVDDCRRAFKNGAWDYIGKNMKGNVFEEVEQSIHEAMTYFNLRGSHKDKEWLEENIELLSESYGGQYIAVLNNTVIETAETEAALKEQLQVKKYPVFMPVIKKIEAIVKPDLSIANLIQLGESATMEFKSTLQWDVRQKQRNDGLRFEVLKTIAAFLNSEGGTLLIGVEDDGTIFGLARDISMVKGKSLDGFELHLMNLISASIGAAFSRLLIIRFEELEGKQVCAVRVKRAAKPVFLKRKNQKFFYIRRGNASTALDIEQAVNYLQMY